MRSPEREPARRSGTPRRASHPASLREQIKGDGAFLRKTVLVSVGVVSHPPVLSGHVIRTRRSRCPICGRPGWRVLGRARIAGWREEVVAAGREGLKSRPVPEAGRWLTEAQRNVGELQLEIDILHSDHYQADIDHPGIARSPALHYEPETNGCAEKASRRSRSSCSGSSASKRSTSSESPAVSSDGHTTSTC